MFLSHAKSTLPAWQAQSLPSQRHGRKVMLKLESTVHNTFKKGMATAEIVLISSFN